MTVLMVAYVIVEVIAYGAISAIEELTDKDFIEPGFLTGSIIGVFIFVICTVGVLIESLKLSKEKK